MPKCYASGATVPLGGGAACRLAAEPRAAWRRSRVLLAGAGGQVLGHGPAEADQSVAAGAVEALEEPDHGGVETRRVDALVVERRRGVAGAGDDKGAVVDA